MKIRRIKMKWLGKNWINIITAILLTWAVFMLFSIIVSPREKLIGERRFVMKEKLQVEIMSINYITNKKFLMRAERNGKQVGIIYFDKEGNIRFDGDKESFEYTLCKAFKIREEEWKR